MAGTVGNDVNYFCIARLLNIGRTHSSQPGKYAVFL